MIEQSCAAVKLAQIDAAVEGASTETLHGGLATAVLTGADASKGRIPDGTGSEVRIALIFVTHARSRRPGTNTGAETAVPGTRIR